MTVTSCASDLVRTPTSLTPLAAQDKAATLHVREARTVTPSTGYAKVIKAGSTWRFGGSIPEGDVYLPVGDVFSVEGANMHEAYLVITRGSVIGFYLPGEHAFAPLPNPVSLPSE